MSTCARCGLPEGDLNGTECCAYARDNGPGTIACRDRELANLRSLLRSQTRRLEEAAEAIRDARDSLDGSDRIQWDTQQAIDLALRDINHVLEDLA